MSRQIKIVQCCGWDDVRKALAATRDALKLQQGEEPWYRGVGAAALPLLPSLFWRASNLADDDLDQLEQNLFFEFQARARELHERNLTDWDYLFFMRHHRVPTRILDWTDSFGVAAYFSIECHQVSDTSQAPCIWVLNPYALNEHSWEVRDLVQPKYLGLVDETEAEQDEDAESEDGEEEGSAEFWDYGELLNSPGEWLHDGPVAIYPLQISDRMRAQRGWFTMFGNSRSPLEEQYPEHLLRIDLLPDAIPEVREFLDHAGLHPYAIYPDLDHLGMEVWQGNQAWIQRSISQVPGRKRRKRASPRRRISPSK